MNILFFHLSDIHCDNRESLVNLKFDCMTKTLRQFQDINEVVIICSGDLANSGQKQEYEEFRVFFDKLKRDIMDETKVDKVNAVIIPGNHDLKFNGDDRECADILNYQKQNILDLKLHDELNLMENFINYAHSQDCFLNSSLYDTKILNLNDFKIQINLLNTAPFSTKENDNKELHYLPTSAINSLIKDDSVNISVTVMHHSNEWFEWNSKKLLDTTITDHTDILFIGHDHDIGTINIKHQSDDTTIICKGGMYSANINCNSTFSIAVLNTETNTLNQSVFDWDKRELIFTNSCNIVNNVIPKTTKINVKESFIQSILADNQNLAEYSTDYFVFPNMTQQNESTIAKKNKTVSEDDFFKLIESIPLISVIGKSNAGKTTVLKYLYQKSIRFGYFPLLLEVENYQKHRNVNKIIRDLFEDQYSEDSADFTRYKQLKKSQRIIIIDDFDRIENSNNRESLLKSLHTEMGCVIISSKESFSLDLTETAKKLLGNETEIVELLISDFFKAKRAELIKKICETDKRLNPADVEDISKIIDFHVMKKTELFHLSPEFIIQCVKYFMELDKRDRKNETVFNVIFETNIKNSIIENAKTKDVADFLISLEEIAYFMHFQKTERITTEQIQSIITAYNTKHALKINAKHFVDTVRKARILTSSNDNFDYQFSSRNYLAYFVANKINKLINRKGGDIPELYGVIDNICFGINDTILMFLSYIRSNTNFAMNLCNKAETLLSNIPELDFDQSNIKFIKGDNKSKITLPTKSDRKEYQEYVENIEKNRIEEEVELRYKGLYDYNENDRDKLEYKLSRALKYIEIVAKSLNSQFSILEAEEKYRIVDCLYRLPNKVLYAVLKRAEDQFDYIIQDLKEYFDVLDVEKKPSEDDLKRVITDSALSLCLSLYDNFAFCSANEVTMPILDKYDFRNSNYSIMNLQMKENGAKSEEFITNAYTLAKNTDDEFLHHLIKMVVRKHVITNTEIDYRQLDKLATPITINGKKRILFDKRQLLMISGKVAQENEKED